MVGALVDQVRDVLELQPAEILHVPYIKSVALCDHLLGMTTLGRNTSSARTLAIIDLQGILEIQQQSQGAPAT